MVYVAAELTRGLALRVAIGRIVALNGPLSSTAADLTLSYAFGVGR